MTVLEGLAAHPRVVAVGETGMDLYWPGRLDGCAEPAQQREAFAWHIDLAKRTGKPLMIHNRDADAEVLDVLRAEGAPETVIFHCFSSGPDMARACVDAGWYLSLSGTVSFRNAAELREAAALIPADQLLVETDAPFLTPHPYRGAPNEPYCLPYTVRALADLTGAAAEETRAGHLSKRSAGLRTRPDWGYEWTARTWARSKYPHKSFAAELPRHSPVRYRLVINRVRKGPLHVNEPGYRNA